ncbi:thiolase family protein [Vibrio tapetis subsp. quintayensis]|uniref:thiolase family protein n=1 Tax=Vibrio tapetis TaxID=52443 RepID=UPI0025B37B31|nr:thiolase family protein [Vibrio tapetis]MDN3678764.1 thiolase family protein [Vibrio tapetis subsp. quintayensis]
MDKTIWVVAAKRTPIGRFQGMLKEFTAPQLGQVAIQSALNDLTSDRAIFDLIQEVFMGCVLPAGCGQAPARQAAMGAGLSYSVGCTTINKVCGSGMKSVMLAYDLIQSGSAKGVLAGGMESMTNAPYLLKDARSGLRLGHKKTFDHMFLDGLQDAYSNELMGVYADSIAQKYDISRDQMDQWALLSLSRALEAQQSLRFSTEIAPVVSDCVSASNSKSDRQSAACLDFDEHPREIKSDKIPHLRPAFSPNGRVTAANASSISDGAAALVLMDADYAKQHGLKPLAKIVGHTTHARSPSEFTIAPIYAIEQLLTERQWSVEDVDLWEINEAFAVVTQIAVQQLKLDIEKVNVNGGACALGHPIGASGARIIVTLIHALRCKQATDLAESNNKSQGQSEAKTMRGIATLCIGGGEATAIAIEIEGA